MQGRCDAALGYACHHSSILQQHAGNGTDGSCPISLAASMHTQGCNFSKEEAPPLSEDGTESQHLPDKGQPVSQRSKSFANLEDLMGSDEIMEYLPTTGPLTAKEYKVGGRGWRYGHLWDGRARRC